MIVSDFLKIISGSTAAANYPHAINSIMKRQMLLEDL